MKLLKFVLPLFVLVLAGGFLWLALTDVSVEQRDIGTTIPNERFFSHAAQ